MMKLFSEWMKKQRNNMQINKYMGMILGGEINERKKTACLLLTLIKLLNLKKL